MIKTKTFTFEVVIDERTDGYVERFGLQLDGGGVRWVNPGEVIQLQIRADPDQPGRFFQCKYQVAFDFDSASAAI